MRITIKKLSTDNLKEIIFGRKEKAQAFEVLRNP
jgi:hypothetical protein